MVIFNKSKRTSYQKLDFWLEETREHVRQNTIFVFAGNKCDLNPQVSIDELHEIVLEYQIPYTDISTKTGQQIDN